MDSLIASKKLVQDGLYEEAIQMVRQVLHSNNNWEAFHILGSAFFNLGNYSEAALAFNNSLALNFSNETLKRYAWSLYKNNNFNDAIIVFEKIKHQDHDWMSLQALGNLYLNKLKYQVAVESFTRSLDLYEDWESYKGLGWALFFTHQYQLAIEAFYNSIALNEDWDSYKGLGWALSFSKQYKKAVFAFKKSFFLRRNIELS